MLNHYPAMAVKLVDLWSTKIINTNFVQGRARNTLLVTFQSHMSVLRRRDNRFQPC